MIYKRVVLFGAGASFGSRSILPVPPPLGVDLYKLLARAFPKSWGAVSGSLKERFEEHFEIGMGELWSMYPAAMSPLKDGAPSPNVLMQDLARFFMSFRIAPNQQDLYSRFLLELLKRSKANDTCFATLNYEILLEQAMYTLRLRSRVARPHGGCHLWPKGGGKIWVSGRALGQGLNSVSATVKPLRLQTIEKLLNKPNQAKYPCMAIYVKGKVTQMAQRYLWRIQNRLHRHISACESLSLIGVRPWPEDHHIWDSVFQTNATVFYVGSRNDYLVLDGYRAGNRQTCFVSERFENALENLAEII